MVKMECYRNRCQSHNLAVTIHSGLKVHRDLKVHRCLGVLVQGILFPLLMGLKPVLHIICTKSMSSLILTSKFLLAVLPYSGMHFLVN